MTSTALEVNYIWVKMRDSTLMDDDDIMYAPKNNCLSDYEEDSFREIYWETFMLVPAEVSKLEWNDKGFVKITSALKHILNKRYGFKFREQDEHDPSQEIWRTIIMAQIIGEDYNREKDESES